MTTQEIIEGNKLIAEFMTGEKYNTFYLPEFGHYFNSYGNIEYTETFSIDELKYNSSWEWIMPVAKKIYNFTNLLPKEEEVWVAYYALEAWLGDINIEQAFSTCVKFIKWYNQNKN